MAEALGVKEEVGEIRWGGWCQDFLQATAEEYMPLVVSGHEEFEPHKKKEGDPAYDFDERGEEVLERFLRNLGFSGWSFSEERGWRQWEEGEVVREDVGGGELEGVVVVLDPLDGSSALAKRLAARAKKQEIRKEWLQSPGTAVTVVKIGEGGEAEVLACGLIDYGLRRWIVMEGKERREGVLEESEGGWRFLEEEWVGPEAIPPEGRVRTASLFVKEKKEGVVNRSEEWQRAVAGKRLRIAVTGGFLGVDGLVDWLRGESHVLCDLHKGQPWYELVPYVSLIKAMGGEVWRWNGEKFEELNFGELLREGFKNGGRVRFAAGIGLERVKEELKGVAEGLNRHRRVTS